MASFPETSFYSKKVLEMGRRSTQFKSIPEGSEDDDVSDFENQLEGEDFSGISFDDSIGDPDIEENNLESIDSESNESDDDQPSTSKCIASTSKNTKKKNKSTLTMPSIVKNSSVDAKKVPSRKKNVINASRRVLWRNSFLLKNEKDVKFIGNSKLPQEILDLQTPFQCFKYFFSDCLIKLIVNQTVLYSVQSRPDRPIVVDVEEMELFISIVIWMSMVHLPRSRLYWNPKFRLSQIVDFMTVNRWEEIKRFLHFNDNSTMKSKEDPEFDKLHKIRPLIDALKKQMNTLPKEEHLSIDEQIIPFKGHSSLKQYNKSKPHRWGYKVYVLSGVSGMCYDFEFFTGKEDHQLPEETDCGKSGNVVIRLSRGIPQNENYKVYYDNYFNSLKLQIALAKNGILSVGTVRINRLPGTGIIEDKTLAKKGRGSFEEKTANVDGIDVSLVKWSDNRCVHLLSTYVGSQPEGKVRRWFARDKAYHDIQLPHVVAEYNKHMGGVDLLDSLNGLYRNRLRSKKWYFRIFTHFLDMTITEAWLFYRRIGEELHQENRPIITLAEFKVEVAESLSKVNKSNIKKRGRPSASPLPLQVKRQNTSATPNPTMDVRRDGIKHYVVWCKERLRCKYELCNGQTRAKCNKCNVALCSNNKSNCFIAYHEK